MDDPVARLPGLHAFSVALALTAACASAAPPESWPSASRVESQPLLAQVARVEAALELLGSPLPAETRAALKKAREADRDEAVTAAVEAALDPFCVAAVRIAPGGGLSVSAPKRTPELIMDGWSAFLIKVLNDAGTDSMLQVESPNAGAVPNAPPEEVKKRWLDLHAYNSQPVLPALGGLALEYRVLELYSRDAGDLEAELRFRLGAPEKLGAGADTEKSAPGRRIRLWGFDGGTEDWRAAKDQTIEARDGVLWLKGAGNDQGMDVDVAAPGGGPFVLRLGAKVDRDSNVRVSWWTREKPGVDRARQRSFQVSAEGPDFRECSARFDVEGDLAGLRLVPQSRRGTMQIDWISLSRDDGSAANETAARIKFHAAPSVDVTFRVLDEKGQTATASFLVKDSRGRVHPAQGKRLEPDFFFQPQIYRADGETLKLPAGEYTVLCQRGPESVPEPKRLVVGTEPVVLAYEVKRWIDPAALGWWSGDHHIHAAGCLHYTNPTEGVNPESMARHIMGEDLKVGSALTWGPCFDFQKRFFTGVEDTVSRRPYILRYDIEVSGFGSHQSGHLCLLRLKEQLYPGGDSKNHWPTLGLNTLRWAKRQGAVTGPAHSAAGLMGSVGRVDARDGPDGLPSYDIPPYDGIGANEFIVDITHEVPGPDGKLVPAVDFISTMDTDRRTELNMWYHTLNCGFRVRASGETDFPCITGARVGVGRVYVKVDGSLDYDRWCDGISAGRSYVSDGSAHILEFEAAAAADTGRRVAVGTGASELSLEEPALVRLVGKVAARVPGEEKVKVEAVVNGLPVAAEWIAADGKLVDVKFEVKVERSSWTALRVFPSAHTNPVFVLVAGKPIRVSRREVEWCLKGVDQCWSQKERFYDEDEMAQAREAYEHARRTYRRLLDECPPGS